MRYQERIYIQSESSSVRNKDISNVNMSSDMCIFDAPEYTINGGSVLNCTGATGTSYVINTTTTIPLVFTFTGDTNTFTATSATFKYELYKYDSTANAFLVSPIYKSSLINYSGFSGTNITTQNIPISGISLDGEYIVKGYYEFNACTDFLNRLGKKIDTLTYRNGTQYGIYDSNLDYYFIATTSASTPNFVNNNITPPPSGLFQQVIIPDNGQRILTITNNYVGSFVLTLNGLVLAPNYDYTYIGNVVTLTAATVSDDIISVIYTTGAGNVLIGDNIYVTTPVASGATNNQGSNLAYYNTTTSKYEIYATTTPYVNGSIIVMLNGATLSEGADYYQSITNPKRIILEGDVVIGDILTIIYFPTTNTIGGITTNTPVVSWSIAIPPQAINGTFTLEVSSSSSFSVITYSSVTAYVVGQTNYSTSFTVSGDIGTKLYYRVKNNKNYATICGNIVNSVTYSEIIPLIVQTNSINSY